MWLFIYAGLFFVGVCCSAFFSGSETGFYRATRVRLVLDAKDGDLTARLLLWFVNNPAMFVATTLVGNNVANYLTSLAVVLAAGRLMAGDSQMIELAASVATAPIIFIYGELLPKNLYFHAPNYLLRWGGPPFVACALLFAPASLVLWLLGRMLGVIVGESPERLRSKLVRRELRRILQEGQEAGVLAPAQRALAGNLFSISELPIIRFALPAEGLPAVQVGQSKETIFAIGKKFSAPALPVKNEAGQFIGYVRLIELRLAHGDELATEIIRTLIEIDESTTYATALMRIQTGRESLARVVSSTGEERGMLQARALVEPLFRST